MWFIQRVNVYECEIIPSTFFCLYEKRMKNVIVAHMDTPLQICKNGSKYVLQLAREFWELKGYQDWKF